MHWLVLENIAYVIFYADTARLLQYFNNISDRFRNILEIFQYFQQVFLQYCLNISVLCGNIRLFRCENTSYIFFLII